MNNGAFQQCLNAAYRYLSYRPRSEEELRQRLKQHGYNSEVLEKTITKLKELNLIDDAAFAQFWKNNRLAFKPKSKRLIMKELRDKKIAPEVIEQVTQDIDDEANAYGLGFSRMHALTRLNYSDFYRRLSSYLGYRGFSYGVIKHVIALLWQEREHH
jgi:regulatory protein